MMLHKDPGRKGSQKSDPFSSLNLDPRPTRVTPISSLNLNARKGFLKGCGNALAGGSPVGSHRVDFQLGSRLLRGTILRLILLL